jgi:3-oxoadipate enol-lactonase
MRCVNIVIHNKECTMLRLPVSPGVDINYVVDDFTDPWRRPETILLCHGNNESHLAWYGWVPHLARNYRVVRPDMRGFGDSTPMARNFPWTLDVVIEDYLKLMDHLGIERFHLVGAKIGGVIGRAFAARCANRIHTLTVVGSPPPVRADRATRDARVKEVEEMGIEHWARRSMASRLGSAFPQEGVEWWINYMGRTAVSTEAGFAGTINFSDISEDVKRITCPMLVITTQESGLASVAETRAWQEQVPHSELVVLPGNSFHAAATDPEPCSRALLNFLGLHHEIGK